MILTPKYAQKANKRKGGVGAETIIITSEIYNSVKNDKFIPILRKGPVNKALPIYCRTRFYLDMTGDNNDEKLSILLKQLLDIPLEFDPFNDMIPDI